MKPESLTGWTDAVTHVDGTQEVQIKSPEDNAMVYWLAFMRWRNNSDYEADHVFIVQQHNAVLPIEIAQYLKFKQLDVPYLLNTTRNVFQSL